MIYNKLVALSFTLICVDSAAKNSPETPTIPVLYISVFFVFSYSYIFSYFYCYAFD